MRVQKSPTLGYSYRTRNILPRLIQKSPSYGYSYRSRNILTRLLPKRWFLFFTILANASVERLSTVSSPYMVHLQILVKNQSLHIIRVQMTDLEKSWDSNSNLLHNFSRSFDNDWFPWFGEVFEVFLVFLYNPDPKEPFIVQIFLHLYTDFFAIVEALIIYLIKNTFSQVRKSFAKRLHVSIRNLA